MIKRYDDLDPITPAWALYYETFMHVNRLAAQRHLMTADEFADVASDPRLGKHVAADDTGRLQGLGVITNELPAWPLISPAYFAHRWPDHYRQKRIFYIGFVCARPDAPSSTFRDIISDMSEQVFAADGIAVMDFCMVNVKKGLPRATTWLLNELHAKAAGSRIDAQEFWAWRFDGQEP
jgi:hypothetical protein